MTQAATDTEAGPISRHLALYCTPHIKIPGTLSISTLHALFDPDPEHPHVREFGVDQYTVHLEVSDIFECGAIVMPLEERGAKEGEVGYFLQLHVRTLDGVRFCAKDVETAWCLVFRVQQRDELYEAARLLLDSIHQDAPEEEPLRARQSRTSVPFSCLDCLAELEATRRQRQQLRQQRPEPEPQLPWRGGRKPRQGQLSQGSSGHGAAAEPPAQLPKVTLQPGEVAKTLLTPQLAECLLDYLPIGLRLPGAVEWVLRYTPKAHGVSMETLYRNLADREKSILLVEDAEFHLFGGFAPAAWEPCHGRFYGSGEAFVFSFGRLGGEPEVRAYTWTSRNGCFMYADHELLAMGGGDGRHAVRVRSDLLRGCSSPTATYGNPTLAGSEEFVVRDLEVWTLEEVE
mmetsp:Transcript_116160/g.339728  ORF Transcript_116160/g.339728 Transcript_116160/m.339728 type:complete len:401 (+) Transcript_116160:190-1392(+)